MADQRLEQFLPILHVDQSTKQPGSIVKVEMLQSLYLSGISSLLGNKSLLQFSLLNKQCHHYFFDTICNQMTFAMVSDVPLTHYCNPKRLFVLSPHNLQQFSHSLTQLECYFDQPVAFLLLANITHLTFGNTFDQAVDLLPPNITHLTFGENFNQPVDHLPSSITHLTFGYNFNQPVNHLPPNIIHLTFGFRFNQPTEHLPLSIILSVKRRGLGRASKE